MVICTCTVHCHGHKNVSDRTWRLHKKFRGGEEIQAYDEYLAERRRLAANNAGAAPPAPRKQLLHAPKRTRKRRRTAEDVSGDEADRDAEHNLPSEDDFNEVSSFSRVLSS